MNTEPANRGLEVVIEGGNVSSTTLEVPASVLRRINGLVERGLDPSIADNLRQFIEHGQVGEQAARSENTVNVAEYLALIAGLTAYRDAGGQGSLLVHRDSQLVIRQVSREWRIKAANLQPLAQQVWTVVAQIASDVTFQWRRDRKTRRRMR